MDYNARHNGEYEKIWQSTGKCVFCDLKDKYIIKEIDNVVLTVNLFPYIDGHLMIIPRKHSEYLNELSYTEWDTIQELLKIGTSILKKSLKIEDVWLLYRPSHGFSAGKSVSHTHLHIIPYHPSLHKIEYQKITIPPIELAANLRKAL